MIGGVAKPEKAAILRIFGNHACRFPGNEKNAGRQGIHFHSFNTVMLREAFPHIREIFLIAFA
jgi:hypothetical protein